MGLYQKFCEWGTDAEFVPHGYKCDLCGKKLGFFATGFWSVNAKRLTDGVICGRCLDKLKLLAKFSSKWVPAHLIKEPPFKAIAKGNPYRLDVQSAKTVLESPEKLGRNELENVGSEYSAIFRMVNACFIEPTAFQVGIKRAGQLNNKLVLFGFVQMGQFKKGDRVLILDDENRRKAIVLEAYVYDHEVPENTLDVELKANMGRQQLKQWQSGWLVLDDEDPVAGNTMVIG